MRIVEIVEVLVHSCVVDGFFLMNVFIYSERRYFIPHLSETISDTPA